MYDDFDKWLDGREPDAPADDGRLLRAGQCIGAYRIIRMLGAGGMGAVYEAEHVSLGVTRALKVFSTESKHPEFLRKRFVAEGRILADLQHPRIVRVYNLVVDEDSGMAYFEMDLVLSPSGEPCTLADRLQDGVSEEEIVGWFKDICEGLAYIHSQGVVHRDISLDNILIGRDGRAVITDFGVAKIIDDSYRRKIAVTATMVYKDGTEVRMGKDRYMAPELKKQGGKVSFASDAWAVGVVLFKMLSGSWYDEGTHLDDWCAEYKYDWCPVIARLCNVDPEKRLGGGGIAAMPELLKRKFQSVPSWRQKLVIGGGIVVALLFVAFGAFYLPWKMLIAVTVTVVLMVIAAMVYGIGTLRNFLFDHSMRMSGRRYPADRSFSILPIDDTELLPLDELGITGWGMGGTDDCPVVFIQKLAYDGDFKLHKELQSKVGATYGGRTTVCEEEATNKVLRVEIDDWREGDRQLYIYRKLFVAGKVIYQVSGQTQMRTKERDRAKLKTVVDSFRLK